MNDLDPLIARLKPRLKIAVLHGAAPVAGSTVIHRTFNPRPWKGYERVARDIAAALRREGFARVRTMAEGRGLADALDAAGIQLVWLNTAGVQGCGSMGHAAATLESLGIPYVGHSPAVATLLDDKVLFKQWLQGQSMATADFATWHPATGFRPSFHSVQRLERQSGGPLVVKPAVGRASRHVHWVARAFEAQEAARAIYRHTQDRVLIEPFLPGREFCLAVGPPISRRAKARILTPRPRCLAPLERVFDEGEKTFSSLDLRPLGDGGPRVRPIDPTGDAAIGRELRAAAEKIFTGLHLTFPIRLDVRQDRNGRLHLLEANPKPDLAARRGDGTQSLVASSLEARGESYDGLIADVLAYRLAWGRDFCRPSLAAIPGMATEGAVVGV
ncbi:MAG: D-alanyl-alanine synthetase [Acidobacteriota bacterium]